MLKNYFLIAVRNLSKSLGYTSINVIGLAIGLACCLLITLYVQFETSYEKFHVNRKSIYRYIPRGESEGVIYMQTLLPPGFAPLIADNFQEVEMFTRYAESDDQPLLSFGEKMLDAKPLVLADPDFFKIFSFPIIQGNSDAVLTRPFTLVIARSVAEKYFPQGDAVGKVIRYDNKYDLEITGVFEDVPHNSHLQFTYVTSFETEAKFREWPEFLTDLGSWNYSTYFYIPTEQHIEELAKRIDQKFTEARGNTFNPDVLSDWLQPLEEIHFTKGIKWDSANGNLNNVYVFSAIAILILVIACFNFMNLSTARALNRAKEVGLRKVMGAFRIQLIWQFLNETIILVFISLVLGVILLELLVPVFNSLMGLHLSVTYSGENNMFGFFVLAGLLTGLAAGSYPAFYLSSFAPARVLKGKMGISGSASLRKVLTTLQFGFAVFLMIGTMVVYQQMKFINNTNLGFDKERVVFLSPPGPVWKSREVFRQRLLAHAGIEEVTFSNGAPGRISSTWNYDFPGTTIAARSMNTLIMDYNYMNAYGLQIVEGRNISRAYATDSLQGYLINETAAKELMLEKAVGTPIRALDGKHPAGEIVGVVKDFHYRSLHRKIEPLVLRYDPRNMWGASVKLNGNIQDNLAALEREWKALAPEYPFTYTFVDDRLKALYTSEQNTGILIGSFSILAIVIACLGLLGLTTFMAEQRKKEIGVRKVLGATVSGIVILLSKDFSRLILIAFLIVLPVAWYVTYQWLQSFAYKTSFSLFTFLFPGFIVLAIAFAAVFYQSLKAATANPSDTLRNE